MPYDRACSVDISISDRDLGGIEMEKPTCEVMQDLLLSYCDGVTGKGVTEMLQEHLEECVGCKQRYWEIMHQRERETCEEISKGQKFIEKLRGLRYYMIGIVIGFVLPIVWVVFWVVSAYIETWGFTF